MVGGVYFRVGRHRQDGAVHRPSCTDAALDLFQFKRHFHCTCACEFSSKRFHHLGHIKAEFGAFRVQTHTNPITDESGEA
jgi:hypothetical protein